MANDQNLTNPGDLVDISMLDYFEGKMAQKYATKEEAQAGGTVASVAVINDLINEIV